MIPIPRLRQVRRKYGRGMLILACTGVFAMLAAACQPTPAPTTVPVPTDIPAPTATAAPVNIPVVAQPPQPTEAGPELIDPATLEAIQVKWDGSPHGHTYDLGKGPNTYCSRCHSPQNWDPASKPGKPPSCITCKFPTDPELRIAETMDFVEEDDWAGIPCLTCHPSVEVAEPELAWLNPLTSEHEPVNTPSELCTKCHLTTSGVKASGGRGVTHAIVLGGSAHANWAGAFPQSERPQYCSDCHDPHSAEPKQCVDCHTDVLSLETHMKGTGEAHASLTCLACHDAAGMQVGPHPDGSGSWTTLVSSVSRSGEMTTAYEKSHSVQWLVDCSRCHFADNPWELDVLTPEGNPPAPPSN